MSFFLILSIVLVFLLISFLRFSHEKPVLIDGDGSGFYAYLPAVILYHTTDFSKILVWEKQNRSVDYSGHYFHQINNVLINKFSCGTALMQLPFFLLAWVLTFILGLPADGYSIVFQFGVALSALFWACTGLIFFTKLAYAFGLSLKTSLLFALAGFLGTNLLYYTLFAPAASHIYSFALISMFLYYSRNLIVEYNPKTFYTAAILFGLIILVRPVNVVVAAAIPFLCIDSKTFLNFVKKIQIRHLILAVCLIIVIISPQLIINYLQTGKLFFYGYQNEGFYFSKPEIFNFLFSYRKGWFVYTPFMLLLIPAIAASWKKSKFQFWTFLLFFFLLVYLFASWWNWIYGDSFGMRPMIDFYALFFLIILMFINEIKNNILRLVILLFVLLTISLNLFQTYQFKKGIIHPDSMNREAYWYIFLKSGDEFVGAVADQDEYFYGKLLEKTFFKTLYSVDNDANNWSSAAKKFDLNQTGNLSAMLNSENIFSPSFTYQIEPDLIGRNNLYIIFNVEYYEPVENAATNALFVADISDTTGKTVFYKSFKLKRLPDQQSETWREGSIGFKLPEISVDFKQIKFYIWNLEGQTFYLDSLQLGFYTYQN